jgi:peptidoglycan hydrolase CwlO-like protein
MNSKILTTMKGTAAVLVVALATGCTSGMQGDIDALKTRVDLLEQETAAANANAASAAKAAQNAQATADEALQTAQQAIEYNDATNEKIDRMFQRSQSK